MPREKAFKPREVSLHAKGIRGGSPGDHGPFPIKKGRLFLGSDNAGQIVDLTHRVRGSGQIGVESVNRGAKVIDPTPQITGQLIALDADHRHVGPLA